MRGAVLALVLAGALVNTGCAATIGAVGGIGGLAGYYFLTGGGAMNDENLQREAARVLEVSPDDVEVFNVDRGALNVSWMVRTPDGVFACNADDMVERVSCLPEDEGTP